MSLVQKLDQIVARHAELQAALSSGALDSQKFVAVSKEYSDLGPLVETVNELRKAEAELKDAESMAADPDMKAMAEEEAAAIKKRLPELQQAVKRMLLPKDAADEKNAILEIRAGTGGDEAALFAADLFRMYQRYAAEHRWKFEIMELSDTGIGGYREAIADSGEAPIAVGVTNNSPLLQGLIDDGPSRYGVNFISDRSTFQSGEAGGWSTLNVAKVCVMQAPPLYHTTGEVLDVISTPGLERIARFLAFFVSAVDRAPRERINP